MRINADEWEIYREKVVTRYVVVEDSRVKMIAEKEEYGEALRVIVDGKVAMVSGRRLSDEIADMAVKLARTSQDRLSEFPERSRVNRVEVFDPSVMKTTPEELKDYGEAIASVGNISSAHFSVEYIRREIVNSNGVEVAEEESLAGVVVEAVFGSGSAYEYHESRRLDFEPEYYAERALELARIDDRAEKIDPGRYTVTLSPVAVDQLLSYALYPAFYYENIRRGRSRIGELMGKEAFGGLSITDDPLLDWGVNSCSFDDEGVASRRKVLVDGGVVRGYISDFKHLPESPTGNGFREDYSSYPSTSPTNVVLDFPERGEAEGVYVHAFIGAHTSNFVSGDFSLELMNASIDGKGIKGAMIYGNVYDLLNRISHFGNKVRQVGSTVTPEIVLEGVEIKV
ncbi:MAG: TldD/PmbA family protein [Archaeoglobi archaeon]|nr:TldD/PmbA family protein [Archaeoglobi archaeon]